MFIKFCVCPSFPSGIEGGMWDVIVLIPDHCLSIYFEMPGNDSLYACFGEKIICGYTGCILLGI